MKKIILILLCLAMTYAGFSQTLTTPNPPFGCPNTTHDVTLGVTNNTAVGIPFTPSSYSISVQVFDDNDDEIYTDTQTFSDVIAAGTSKYITFEDVPFEGPMLCSLSFTIAHAMLPGGAITLEGNYTVQYPPTLSVTENPSGTVEVQTAVDNAYDIHYFLDGNYTTPANASGATTYTPTVSGSYTAKAYESTTGCYSAAASNALNITVLSTSVKNGQKADIAVYPNPIASSLTISTGLSSQMTYELADMNGAIVKSGSFTSTANVNVETLKSGTYLLTVKDQQDNIASYKLVK